MPARRERVLIVDDEEQIRRAVGSILKSHDYEVDSVATGRDALSAAANVTPDVVILDLSLPDMDGVAVCTELRTWTEVPILVLSVRGEDTDKVSALDAGADDYLTKPFSASELLARIRALLRRTRGLPVQQSTLVVDDLEIDFARRRVCKAGVEVSLTRTEFDVLSLLAGNADRVLTSHSILETVWGPEYAEDRHTLRVHVSHLRKKIESHPSVPRFVLTEPGVGFMFSTR